MRISQISNHLDIIRTLPSNLQSRNNIAMVRYLFDTVRNKIVNYKKTVNSVFIYKEVFFNLNTKFFECEHSQFCDLQYENMITGELRVIENPKLKKLMTKGPSYRELFTFSFSKTIDNVKSTIDNYIHKSLEILSFL